MIRNEAAAAETGDAHWRVCVCVCVCVCATTGNVPSTDLLRHAGSGERIFSRCVLHGMLRFTKMTRTVGQGAQFICSVATDDKYKGRIDDHLLSGSGDFFFGAGLMVEITVNQNFNRYSNLLLKYPVLKKGNTIFSQYLQ